MTLQHVLVQRSKKIEMKKVTFNNIYKCYRASKFHWRSDLAKSLFCHETNFYWVFLSKVLTSEVWWTSLPNISGGIFLRKQVPVFSRELFSEISFIIDGQLIVIKPSWTMVIHKLIWNEYFPLIHLLPIFFPFFL